MLKELMLDLVSHAGVLVFLLAGLWWLWKLRRLADFTWLAAFMISLIVLPGAVLMQLQGFLDPSSKPLFSDATGLGLGIAVLFGVGVSLNAKTFWQVMRELRGEQNGEAGVTRSHLKQCLDRHAKSDTPLEDAIAEADAEIDARCDLPRLIKRMLPTLGLIGTVIGLALAMQQLGQALADAIGGEGEGSEALFSSMQGALSGMGSASSTTLFGAGFGMLLMVLLSRTRLMITRLIAEAKRGLDEEVRKQAEARKSPRSSKGYFRPELN